MPDSKRELRISTCQVQRDVEVEGTRSEAKSTIAGSSLVITSRRQNSFLLGRQGVEQYQANSELGSPILLSNQRDVALWGWVIPTVILTVTRIEVSANQIEYAEFGYGFAIGCARPLVTFTRLEIYHLAPHNRQMFITEGWRVFGTGLSIFMYIFI